MPLFFSIQPSSRTHVCMCAFTEVHPTLSLSDHINVCIQANGVWVFGALGHHPGIKILEALGGLAAESEQKLQKFPIQNITTMLSGFAKLEHKPSKLLESVCRAILPLLASFAGDDNGMCSLLCT